MKDFGKHIRDSSEKFIENSGSETLNRQRKAISKTLKDPNASGADLAKVITENPYGTLFNAGTEMAGIALPAGGAKFAQKGIQPGMKAAPQNSPMGRQSPALRPPRHPDPAGSRRQPEQKRWRGIFQTCPESHRRSGCHGRRKRRLRWRHRGRSRQTPHQPDHQWHRQDGHRYGCRYCKTGPFGCYPKHRGSRQ